MWDTEKVCTRFSLGYLMERAHFENPGVDGWIILKTIFEKWDGAWNGLIWLRIGTGGGRL
jgi:hypothetical protein